MIDSATEVIKPINAPLPVERERMGKLSFQTRYRIKPISGKKNPSAANPAEGASKGFCCGLTAISGLGATVAVISFSSPPH